MNEIKQSVTILLSFWNETENPNFTRKVVTEGFKGAIMPIGVRGSFPQSGPRFPGHAVSSLKKAPYFWRRSDTKLQETLEPLESVSILADFFVYGRRP